MNKVLLSAISFFALSTAVNAGEIVVINENMKELKIKIEAEGDSKSTTAHTIPADRDSKLTVNKDQLNGKMYYFVKGDTSSFTPGSKCDHLHVDKDYQLTFQNDTAGTTCVAAEMTEDMKANKDMKSNKDMASTDVSDHMNAETKAKM